MIEKKMHSVELIDKMSKEQIRDYWYELKQMRYDGYYYRELYDKIIRMNPNLVMPDRDEISRIEKDALGIAFWEENWEITNERRVRQGGADYSILNCQPKPDRKFAADRMFPGEPAYFRRKAL